MGWVGAPGAPSAPGRGHSVFTGIPRAAAGGGDVSVQLSTWWVWCTSLPQCPAHTGTQ